MPLELISHLFFDLRVIEKLNYKVDFSLVIPDTYALFRPLLHKCIDPLSHLTIASHYKFDQRTVKLDFKPQLKKGKLLKRYKRFFADIEYKGEVLTAHVPNTGSLKSVPLSDTNCLFSTSDDPKRKLKYTLEFIETECGLAGVNTRTPNTIVHEALLEGLKGNFDFVQPEVKTSEKTRIDFVAWSWLGAEEKIPKKLKYPDYLKDKNLKLCFIEVKNVTFLDQQKALFPDGVTERGTKHLNELSELSKTGKETKLIFTVQRESATSFSAAEDIDPVYAKTLKSSVKAGVKVLAFNVEMNKKKACLLWTSPLEIKI